MSVADDLVDEVVGRLRAANLDLADEVRLDHRTSVPLDKSPAIHVVEGDEVPTGKRQGCGVECTKDVVVRIFTRSDSSASLRTFKAAVATALNPLTTAYSHSAQIKAGRIQPIQEIADSDSNRCDMQFRFTYVRDEFLLGEP